MHKRKLKPGYNVLSSIEFIPQGGIGIINTHLYIALKSTKNELVLGSGVRWKDKTRENAEVVVFYQDKVWPKDDLPAGFDLRKAIIVSFEADVVRFFDFQEMDG